MTTETVNRTDRASMLRNIVILIFVLGSLWGAAEVLLNDAIKAADLPLRAGILTGFGMLVMGMFLGHARKPFALLGIPLVAVLIKQMVVPIMGASVLCKANSCIAVLFEASLLAGVAMVAARGMERSGPTRAATGAGAGLLSAVPFYFVGLAVAPCSYLMSFDRAGGFAAFMIQEGLVWAAFSAVLFPLGYALGTRGRETVLSLEARRPAFYYGAALGVVTACWISAAVAISLGA
ncbi:MAG: hypothetical protein PHU25_21420 [Deltaproteobacteria bacterium]|nr:hypothetical protein [Deltaproteobacteria bacterium]